MLSKWLNQTNMSEVELVGGKNASLGEMIQNLTSLGIKIPNGFIITSVAYDEFISNNNLYIKIQNIMKSIKQDNSDLKEKGKLIRNLIIDSKLSDKIK